MLKISCDDGCQSDVRVAELAKKYDVEAIFYIPVEWHSLAYANGYEPLTYEEANKLAWEHTLGSHTITHRHLTRISETQARYEISESKVMLLELFGKEVSDFAPPRGYSNESLTEYTLSIYKSQRLTRGEGLVHVHPNSGANGNKPWRDCVDENTKELFLHSHELNKFNLWEELEEVLREI